MKTKYLIIGLFLNSVFSLGYSQFSITTSSSPTIGGTTSGGGTYNLGNSVTVTANPNSGHTFLNWTENGMIVSINSSYTFMISNSRNLVANFILVGGGYYTGYNFTPIVAIGYR